MQNLDNIEIFITQDGSIGLYDKALDEIYHSKFGAKKESFEKFVEPCFILKKNGLDKNLKLLDICFGIGYNTKCFLENFESIDLIDCIEIDENLAKKSFEFNYSKKIDSIIEKNLKNPDLIHFYFDDARNVIKKSDKKYDVIFLDAFCPHKQSVLWSEDFIFEITKKMHQNSIFCTYNHSMPILKALLQNNLAVGHVIKENKIISTYASFNSDLIENQINQYEKDMLNTKSAITYKDKGLCHTHEEIINYRNSEVQNSSLQTLSQYKKRHLEVV